MKPNVLALALLAVTATAGMATAEIASYFTDGYGSGPGDQYPGSPGDGWVTSWTRSGDIQDTGYPKVISDDPLNSGGNYLSLKKSYDTTPRTRMAYYRQYTNYGDVDLTRPHTISFDYRIDEMSGFNAGHDGDYLQIFENNAGSDMGTTGSWLIRVFGNDFGRARAGYWALYDGTRDGGGYNGMRFVDTGIAANPGEELHFQVDLMPWSGATGGYWDVSITYPLPGGGTATYTRENLGYRGGSSVVADHISFGQSILGTPGQTDVHEWSVDSVKIVPEPSALALLGLGLLAMACWGRWRTTR